LSSLFEKLNNLSLPLVRELVGLCVRFRVIHVESFRSNMLIMGDASCEFRVQNHTQ
jgi:hypothetical protein